MSRNGHAVTCGYMAGGNTGLTKLELDYIAKRKAANVKRQQLLAAKAKRQAERIINSSTFVFFEPK